MGKRVVAAGRDRQIKKSVLVESLEGRRLYASDLGINVNAVNADNYKALVDTLHDAGAKSVRLWYGFSTYQDRSLARVALYAQKFHSDGFHVTLSVNPHKGRHGTADETRGFFEFLGTQPELVAAVDLWELGNEPDYNHYWRGTLPEFVDDFIAPAARVLHNVGEVVASGGVSWNPKDIKTMVDAGLLKHVDVVGYHPYQPNVHYLKSRIAEVKSYVGDTPLLASEWNIRGHENDSDKSDWAAGAAAFWPIIRQEFAYSHYFVLSVMDSLAGPAGVLTAKGRANEPFYSMFMHLQDDVKGGENSGTPDDDGEDDGDEVETPTRPRPEEPSEPEKPDTDSDGGDNGTGSSGEDGGAPVKPNRPNRPARPSTDGEDDASNGSPSTGETPRNPSKPRPAKPNRPSRPTTPPRPSTGTVDAPATPTPVVVAPVPPAISSISLLNASRDRVVKPYAVLSGVTTIDLATTGTAYLSLLASANRKTGSVAWSINGTTVIDSDGTFTLYGEKKGDLVGNLFEAGREYILTAQAFSGVNGTGRAGEQATLNINVIDSAAGTRPTMVDQVELEARRRQADRLAKMQNPAVIEGL